MPSKSAAKPQKLRSRPVEKPLPELINDSPENVMRAILATPPKRDDEWRYMRKADAEPPDWSPINIGRKEIPVRRLDQLSGNRRGKSTSNVSTGKRRETGPLRVFDASKPTSMTLPRTCRVWAGLCFEELRHDQSDHGSVFLAGRCAASGSSLSPRATKCRSRASRLLRSRSSAMKVTWSTHTFRNQREKATSAPCETA